MNTDIKTKAAELNDSAAELVDKIIELSITYGLDLLGAIILLIVGWTIASWGYRQTRKACEKTNKIDKTLEPVIASLVKYVILIFVVVAVLAQFGVQTASIIAVLGAAGLAIGLALQGALSNIASGILLLALRPFNVGDYIDAEGTNGTVEQIGLFLTHLKTPDGIFRAVPNSQITSKAITNFSRNMTRRIDIVVGIAYEDDIGKGQDVLLETMKAENLVSENPGPEVFVDSLGDSSVNLNMRCWVNTSDYWPALFALRKAAKLDLDKAGISIPFPQRDVHIIKEE
ncbi:MAG: mechanosensitive ion channel family protein [Rhodospirillales bacterium]